MTSELTVERIGSLSGRPAMVYVSGRLNGEPLRIGDDVSVRDGTRTVAAATVRSIEMHSAPGRTTIALDAGVEAALAVGVVVVRVSS